MNCLELWNKFTQLSVIRNSFDFYRTSLSLLNVKSGILFETLFFL